MRREFLKMFNEIISGDLTDVGDFDDRLHGIHDLLLEGENGSNHYLTPSVDAYKDLFQNWKNITLVESEVIAMSMGLSLTGQLRVDRIKKIFWC